MKFTLSNQEMLEKIEVLSMCAEKGKLGYAIARNTRYLKDAAKEYIDMRNELFRKYGKKDSKNAGRLVFPNDDIDKFEADLGEIPTIKHKVELMQVSESDFINSTLTSRQMEMLLWMIEEPGKKGE